MEARYAHTNLIARDWRRLARFYAEAFGCELLAPLGKTGN
jgi:predicted enzyme related to lactoylglutathione lyase